jgi:hypothetical protein
MNTMNKKILILIAIILIASLSSIIGYVTYYETFLAPANIVVTDSTINFGVSINPDNSSMNILVVRGTVKNIGVEKTAYNIRFTVKLWFSNGLEPMTFDDSNRLLINWLNSPLITPPIAPEHLFLEAGKSTEPNALLFATYTPSITIGWKMVTIDPKDISSYQVTATWSTSP